MHCSVIEQGMTSLSFQTAIQKNEAKLTSSGVDRYVPALVVPSLSTNFIQNSHQNLSVQSIFGDKA